MLTLDQAQIDTIQQTRRERLILKLDQWLTAELPIWMSQPGDVRHGVLSEIVDVGTEADLQSEADFALLARLLAEMGETRQAFLAHPRVTEVLDWDVRNPGAKLRELYRLAETGPET